MRRSKKESSPRALFFGQAVRRCVYGVECDGAASESPLSSSEAESEAEDRESDN